ncbi:hypothetical protein E4U03_11855 [Rothia nasimurium]|uniref:Holin n=1 Tax=Rothia nasimurium TaxID=85336 RepID=A0A4Y9F091_9MICC|nr:hypothetical protein [Rothia nasimurium]MBF0809293.1 hypothetical protein [Rothia nasimurium]TFU20090.1 hypothetical protein E4U03_11855 [Rothia nasimurium]
MNVLDNSTRRRSIGSTTAFATGGTTAGYALAVLAYELFNLPLSTEGVLALALVLSLVGAVVGGWAAPSKKAETEAYLGSVLAMAQQGDHGRLGTTQPPAVEQVEPATATEQEQPTEEPELTEIPDGYELVDTAGTEYSNPAYALGK